MTCYTGDHHHVEAHQPTPEIIAGPDHAHHTNQVNFIQFQQDHSKPQDKKQERVKIDDPQSDYYSSDDTSSDSEDDLN